MPRLGKKGSRPDGGSDATDSVSTGAKPSMIPLNRTRVVVEWPDSDQVSIVDLDSV